MANKHFEIEGWSKSSTTIRVNIAKEDIGIEITIPRKKFEFWLLINEKLLWEIISSDHTGEHVQAQGTMSYEEYWDGKVEYIESDLYEYITTNPITYKCHTFDNSLESILEAFRVFPKSPKTI